MCIFVLSAIVKMTLLKQIIFLIIGFLTLQSCQKNNAKIDLNFENEFQDSIKKNDAEFFRCQYDGLTPQKSYFVNSKLRFLKIHLGPELGSVDARIYFDDKTDSIKKNVLRVIEPKDWKTEKLADTIFVIYPNKKLTYAYVDNKLATSKFNKKIYKWNRKFIKNVKKYTEEKYNSR